MTRRTNTRYLLFQIFLPGICIVLCSWGVWGHQHINKAAVFALPDEMALFYYNHIDFITEESVVPDIRKHTYNFKSEGPRHYIDIEDFEKPIDSLPLTPKDASKAYSESLLEKNGSLPWYIQDIMTKLTTAFKNGRKTEILVLSADLGHYLGDAHMPLHTSSNYDGQMTAQSGIHALWESQLPEEFGNDYNFFTRNASFVEDVPAEVWNIIKHSHQLADTVLATEKKLSESFNGDGIYVTGDDGKVIKNKFNQPVHSHAYALAYHKALNGMVESQLRASITATADFWYTAWVTAGKPDLTKMDDPDLTKMNHENYLNDLNAWKKGKLLRLKTDNEF
jgi:hypothetical protein